MMHASLFRQILRLVPAIPVALYHVIKELVEDLVKFAVRPTGVEWPDPSSATSVV